MYCLFLIMGFFYFRMFMNLLNYICHSFIFYINLLFKRIFKFSSYQCYIHSNFNSDEHFYYIFCMSRTCN
jgi:hypothetical protein